MLQARAASQLKSACARAAGVPKSELRSLERYIAGLDRQIMFANKPAAIVCGILFHFYLCGETSTETANALGLSGCGVRQMMNRLLMEAKAAGMEVAYDPEHGYNKPKSSRAECQERRVES